GSGSAIGDALVTHPLVRKVSFTGSTGIGRRIMELASRDLKRISLELGGKSPNIVFADADWQRAAETWPMSVFANTGQDCCARSRVFVERSVCEPFDDEAQIIRDVNASPYGLSGSLWTNDLRRALRVAKAVESGVLSVNSHSSVHAEAPFGGFKQSGIGRDLGMAAMEGYTELKNVYVAE